MSTEQKYIHNVTVTKVPIYDIPVYFVISNDQQKCQKFLGDFKFSSFCAGEFVDRIYAILKKLNLLDKVAIKK